MAAGFTANICCLRDFRTYRCVVTSLLPCSFRERSRRSVSDCGYVLRRCGCIVGSCEHFYSYWLATAETVYFSGVWRWMRGFTVRQSSVVRVWKAVKDMRTDFARVYVLVNVHILDLCCQRGEEAPAYCFPCQLGKWVISHEILQGRGLMVAVSAGPCISHAINQLKCVLNEILPLTYVISHHASGQHLE
jgi:hypothetical protein